MRVRLLLPEDKPFIPASKAGWTSLSLPSSVTTINDYAFYQSQTEADIVIPNTVTAIGTKAFFGAKIRSVLLIMLRRILMTSTSDRYLTF